jgi:hypothetical protein
LVYILAAIYIMKSLEIYLNLGIWVYEQTHDTSLEGLKSMAYLNIFPLECVYALIIEKKYYYILKSSLKTLPRFLSLILQFGALICFFTIILLILINHETPAANKHYHTFGDSLWTNINVMDAADWPAPFIDLFKVSNIIILSSSAFPSNQSYGFSFFCSL